MNRRKFLVACAAGMMVVAQATRTGATAIYERARLVLVGDGVADDTDALQALLDGDADVFRPDGSQVRSGIVQHLTYRLTSPLTLPAESLVRIRDCRFVGDHEGPLLLLPASAQSLDMSGVRLDRQIEKMPPLIEPGLAKPDLAAWARRVRKLAE